MAERASRPQRERTLLIRARAALPVILPPISDVGISISRGRIVDIGPWRSLAHGHIGPQRDLGDALVLPGLINAHCHLDYTCMAGMFAPPRRFTDWIKEITVTKQSWSDEEFRDSWLTGAKMLLRTGTTTVADVEAVPDLLPQVWSTSALRVFSFLEMTGIRSRRDPRGILDEALQKIRQLPRKHGRAWLSPHAPYSTKPQLMQASAKACRQRDWKMTTHVGESELEYEMFKHGRGELYQWLKRNDRDMSDCGSVSPVQHLHRQGALGPHLLAVHANYLGTGDAALLGATRTHVVHCPLSHAYFKHRSFPYRQLNQAGVNICLGTDSLASTYPSRARPTELSMFAEMREFATRNPNVAPSTVLRMATINGATALGRAGLLGSLTCDAAADLVAIPFHGNTRTASSAAVQYEGAVLASMIDGRWVIPLDAS